MPLDRWEVDGLPFPGAARFGGWILPSGGGGGRGGWAVEGGIKTFYAALFGISAQEATVLRDVQNRWEETYEVWNGTMTYSECSDLSGSHHI